MSGGGTLPRRLVVRTGEEMQDLGRALAGCVRPGDLLVLSGDLGAGKTTLVQGLGEGLGVRGPVTSPTFVIARTHPSLVGGPLLVHVDAYRLGGALELDDLDLDADLADAVTVVEWGSGVAEQLAEDRLEVDIRRDEPEGSAEPDEPHEPDEPAPETRTVTLRAVGPRWAGVLTRA